jgi:hypothetical protein
MIIRNQLNLSKEKLIMENFQDFYLIFNLKKDNYFDLFVLFLDFIRKNFRNYFILF